MVKKSFDLSEISYISNMQNSFKDVILAYSGLNHKFLTNDEMLFSLNALKCDEFISKIYLNLNENNGELDYEHLSEFALYLSHLDISNNLIKNSLNDFFKNIGLSNHAQTKVISLMESKIGHNNKVDNLKKSVISALLGSDYRYLTNSVFDRQFVRSDLSKIYSDVDVAFKSLNVEMGLILSDTQLLSDLKLSLLDKKWPNAVVDSVLNDVLGCFNYQLGLFSDYDHLHNHIKLGTYDSDILTNMDHPDHIVNQFSYHLNLSNISDSNYSLDIPDDIERVSLIMDDSSDDFNSLMHPLFRN